MTDPRPYPVFIVSDGTGETAERVTNAALRQFERAPVQRQIFPNTTDRASLERIFKLAALQNAFVVTSLVSAEQRALANELAKTYRILQVDVLGHTINALAGYLGEVPKGMPGLLRLTDAAYFRRIEAVEFTVKADDGKEPRLLHRADIVLVGVSRTSKTPLSVFLAYKGYKVANVPVVLDREPPPTLYQVDQRRVFALTIEPEYLQHIRRQRLAAMRMRDDTNYGQMEYILAELTWADELFRRNRHWPVVNVTGKALEETAATILATFHERGLGVEDGEAGQL